MQARRLPARTAAYPTVTVPFIMVGWYSQWNAYVPAFASTAIEALDPGGRSLLTFNPVIVRLCSTEPEFVTLIVFAPGDRWTAVGEYE